MDEERSLHELLAAAVDRAAEAVEESCALCERHLAVTAEIDDTLQCIRRGRRARRAFGNGQRGAGMRGRPG